MLLIILKKQVTAAVWEGSDLEFGVFDVVDFVWIVNVRVQDTKAIMVIVTDFQMFKDMVTEISLDGRFEKKLSEIQ